MSSTSTASVISALTLKEAGYRSPKRCLAASFLKGRDKWKKKAQDRNKKLKVLKVRVHDLEESRQHHRQQSQESQEAQRQLEHQVRQLQAEVEQLRSQRDELSQVLGSKKV
jgi:TolA-binding protein